MVSPAGLEEYAKYTHFAKEQWFHELFDLLDRLSPQELEIVQSVFSVWGHWHTGGQVEEDVASVPLVKLE